MRLCWFVKTVLLNIQNIANTKYRRQDICLYPVRRYSVFTKNSQGCRAVLSLAVGQNPPKALPPVPSPLVKGFAFPTARKVEGFLPGCSHCLKTGKSAFCPWRRRTFVPHSALGKRAGTFGAFRHTKKKQSSLAKRPDCFFRFMARLWHNQAESRCAGAFLNAFDNQVPQRHNV